MQTVSRDRFLVPWSRYRSGQVIVFATIAFCLLLVEIPGLSSTMASMPYYEGGACCRIDESVLVPRETNLSVYRRLHELEEVGFVTRSLLRENAVVLRSRSRFISSNHQSPEREVLRLCGSVSGVLADDARGLASDSGFASQGVEVGAQHQEADARANTTHFDTVHFDTVPSVMGEPIPAIGMMKASGGMSFEIVRAVNVWSFQLDTGSFRSWEETESAKAHAKPLHSTYDPLSVGILFDSVPPSYFSRLEAWQPSITSIRDLETLSFSSIAVTDVELWEPRCEQVGTSKHPEDIVVIESRMTWEAEERDEVSSAASESSSLSEKSVNNEYVIAPLDKPDFGISNGPYFWWTEVGDPVLSRLIVEAITMNPTAREAAARVVESRAFYDRATADRYPILGGSLQYDNRQFSQNGNAFLQKSASTSGFDFYAVGLESRWEVDLWGQLAKRRDAAYAEYRASDFDLDDIRLSLIAEIVQGYIELCLLNTQLVIARENAEVMRLGVSIAQTYREAGKSGALDERLARNQYTTTIAEIPALELRRDRVIHRLMALRGKSIEENGVPLKDYFALLPVRIPDVPQRDIAEVFRRPDVKAAKKRMYASGLKISVAKRDLLPKLTVDGRISADTRNAGRWFEDESIAYNVGPTLEWELVDFGRRRSGIRAAEAELDAMKAEFNRILSEACEEVRNALAELVRSTERAEILKEAVHEAREITTMALTEYQSGLGTFQGVLDAQRQRIIIEENAAITRANGWLAWVKYHRSIGVGGR